MPQLSAVALSTLICGMASGFSPTPSPQPFQHPSEPTFAAELTDMVRALAVHLHVVRNISRAQHLATHVAWHFLLMSYSVCPQSILRCKSCLTFLGRGEGRGGLSGELELWGVGRRGQEVKGIRALGICDL